ncbi:LacI family transcriptional regulator [Neobacillus piezotolerans]|uniref:LacI family transcriptional regulator n=1 Tax=Neobacillus piezotolerans TaxID=2259171 RepID=A0A3D8GW43_9BACI|nr:LacI family DNA-binding transcriptional regulator [Neobacillus piezotolerans]RDU38256.1 LacI family transcriptional regulator [Neobacillus piezotolerans]
MKKGTATIRDVAREAGVSVATVSRYINNNGYVSENTLNKIKHVMEVLNYHPNEIARGLARKRTNTIALVIPDITNPFFPELVVSIEKVAKEKGYRLILINSDEDSIRSSTFWRSLESRYTDGLILASFQFKDSVLKELNAMNIPFVRIDRAADKSSTDSIGIDNYKGAKLAVNHLFEIGCRKIAHICGPPNFQPSLERIRGYKDELAEKGVSYLPIILEGDFSLESGKTLTDKLLYEHPDVDGIFLANDMMAIGSLKILKQLGIKVPEDIAIIGFDGIKLVEMVDPEISTIEQPIYDIGVVATSRLIDMIENVHATDEEVQLDVRLVKRESTLGFKKKKCESS